MRSQNSMASDTSPTIPSQESAHSYALKMLVAAGFVTQQKVDEALQLVAMTCPDVFPSQAAPASPPVQQGVVEALESAVIAFDMGLSYPDFDCDDPNEPRPLCSAFTDAQNGLLAALASLRPPAPLMEKQ